MPGAYHVRRTLITLDDVSSDVHADLRARDPSFLALPVIVAVHENVIAPVTVPE